MMARSRWMMASAGIAVLALLLGMAAWTGTREVLASSGDAYQIKVAEIAQARLDLARAELAAVKAADDSRADYTTGQRLRELLERQGDVSDQAWALWTTNPDRLSAFWLYQAALYSELSLASKIMAVEWRAEADEAWHLATAQDKAAVAASEAALDAVAREMMQQGE